MLSPISSRPTSYDSARIQQSRIAQTNSIQVSNQQEIKVPKVNRIQRNDTVQISARGRQIQQQQARVTQSPEAQQQSQQQVRQAQQNDNSLKQNNSVYQRATEAYMQASSSLPQTQVQAAVLNLIA